MNKFNIGDNVQYVKQVLWGDAVQLGSYCTVVDLDYDDSEYCIGVNLTNGHDDEVYWFGEDELELVND